MFGGGDGIFGGYSNQYDSGGFLTSSNDSYNSSNEISDFKTILHEPSLKASMLYQSCQTNPGDPQISILETPIEKFKLVGYIRKRSYFDEDKMSFDLDDGSAVICVEWPFGSLYEADGGMSEFRKQKIESIKENEWVSVYGEVNLLGKQYPHVKANMVRGVENFMEVFFHDIDVANFIALKTFGPPLEGDHENQMSTPFSNRDTNKTQNNDIVAKTSHVEMESSKAKQTNVPSSNSQHLDPATGVVLRCLKQLCINSNEVKVHEMLRWMRREGGYPNFTDQNLHNALEILSDENLAYWPSDRNSWKPC